MKVKESNKHALKALASIKEQKMEIHNDNLRDTRKEILLPSHFM